MPMPEASHPVSTQRSLASWLRARLLSRTAAGLMIAMVVGMACNQTTESGSSGNTNDRQCKISLTPGECLGFGGVGGTYFNELYVQSTLWLTLRDTLAANQAEQLFVTDGDQIYMIDNGVASVYLTNAELATVLGIAPFIDAIDVGPDNNLYILNGSLIGMSTAPGNISLAFDAGPGFFRSMSVESASRVILGDLVSGLVAVDAGGGSLLVPEALIGGMLGGDMYGISVDIVNSIVYNLPGSFQEELWSASSVDGSNPTLVLPDGSIANSYFHGLGKAPNGGVLVNLGNNIVEVLANGQYTFLNIAPTIDAVVVSLAGHVTTFVDLNIAVSPNGVIYAISDDAPSGRSEIFRMTPN